MMLISRHSVNSKRRKNCLVRAVYKECITNNTIVLGVLLSLTLTQAKAKQKLNKNKPPTSDAWVVN